MKVRLPKHREFVIHLDETKDNEEKVKELQKEYNFTYDIEER